MGLAPLTITPREYDVLVRLGMKSNEIANDLGLSMGTINKHYYKLSAKLNASSRTEILVKALKIGLIHTAELII